ncbi:ubiquinol-cytochrome c reductase iron-sulfur subunit [Candidatus Sororendozoicomonas aggregata]|uniref:ubiquinol-cytochrome c reductase iron-sulfur subunit n=1 Tax=Candidatus Sororendozoicomonas aggregata TaxID=3073239 RepID=UPI002ED64911
MSDNGVNTSRRRFLVAATSVVGAAGAVGVATPFVKSWNPSAKAKAAGAPVKVNVSKLQPGQQVVYEWRGKPVFVVRRTPEMLATLKTQDDRLRDPLSEKSTQPEYAKNPARALKDEYLVLLGICTHLGCSPKFMPEVKPMEFDAKWQGGYFCPCHGSRFDLAGRVYQGVPAPTNLEIPPYVFETNDILIIGSEGTA